MRIAIISDAWFPQVNGVVRTLDTVRELLVDRDYTVSMITPEQFRTVPCPTYPEIRLAINPWRLGKQLDAMRPDCVHIATEGPLGLAARRYCRKRGLHFTTSYHTKFPEYINKRTHIPVSVTYRLMRWFHNGSKGMLVATPSLQQELTARGFHTVKPWTRGVDTRLFHPQPTMFDFPRPLQLYTGRIAVEKNLEAFLETRVAGTKLLVGDGPDRERLERAYPDAVFVGAKFGKELAQYYAAADVFVFPSKTDTFGLVMLEALASGTPVAAYPVTGPIDVITSPEVGALDDDLEQAIRRALKLDREACRRYAISYSWENCARMFESNLYKNSYGSRGYHTGKERGAVTQRAV